MAVIRAGTAGARGTRRPEHGTTPPERHFAGSASDVHRGESRQQATGRPHTNVSKGGSRMSASALGEAERLDLSLGLAPEPDEVFPPHSHRREDS